jgi:hypothetical protein
MEQLRELANVLAFNHVHRLRSMADGTDHDWRLLAAEYGILEEEYVEQKVALAEEEFLTQLDKLSTEMRAALIDMCLAEPEPIEPKVEPGPLPNNVILLRRKRQ